MTIDNTTAEAWIDRMNSTIGQILANLLEQIKALEARIAALEAA